MKRRWYDLDPTLSLAVSLMANSDEKTRSYCAGLIMEFLNNNNIKPNNNLTSFIENLKRWYDDNKELSLAMNLLKNAPEDLRKNIALEIIEILQAAEVK